MEASEYSSVRLAFLVSAVATPTLIWLAARLAPSKGKNLEISRRREKINTTLSVASVIFFIGGAESVFLLEGTSTLPPEIRSAVLVLSLGTFSAITGTTALSFLVRDPWAAMYLAQAERDFKISADFLRRLALSSLAISGVLFAVFL